MANDGRGGIQSVHRALDILELISRASVLGVTPIADRLKLSVSTVHGIIRTLTVRHFLLRVPGGYRIGPAAAGLSSRWDPARSLLPLVDPLLHELSAETGLASTATVLLGREARIIASVQAPGPLTVRVDPAIWREPLGLATGRLLIAMTGQESWRGFIQSNTSVEPHWTPARWKRELGLIRSRSVAIKVSSDPREDVSMAVPVLGPGGIVVCAIGCFCPAFLSRDLFSDHVMTRLWSAADDLSAFLGGPSVPRAQMNFSALISTPSAAQGAVETRTEQETS